ALQVKEPEGGSATTSPFAAASSCACVSASLPSLVRVVARARAGVERTRTEATRHDGSGFVGRAGRGMAPPSTARRVHDGVHDARQRGGAQSEPRSAGV